MTGIVAGTAALVGAAFGWSGALVVALLTVLALAIWSSRPPWANCAVAMVAVVLGAWSWDRLHQWRSASSCGRQGPRLSLPRRCSRASGNILRSSPLLATDRLTLDGRLASA